MWITPFSPICFVFLLFSFFFWFRRKRKIQCANEKGVTLLNGIADALAWSPKNPFKHIQPNSKYKNKCPFDSIFSLPPPPKCTSEFLHRSAHSIDSIIMTKRMILLTQNVTNKKKWNKDLNTLSSSNNNNNKTTI